MQNILNIKINTVSRTPIVEMLNRKKLLTLIAKLLLIAKTFK